MDFLGRALSVSKYCQNVILGSADIRRTLFFEPAPAADYIWTMQGWGCDCDNSPACGHQDPIKGITVEAHPALKRAPVFRPGSYFPSIDDQRFYLPYNASHKILCTSLDNAPTSAFVFQPPPSEVAFFYLHRSILVERSGGITFGAIREELGRQRKESQEMINTSASAAEERTRLQTAMGVLSPSQKTDFDGLYRDGPCIFLNVHFVTQNKVTYESCQSGGDVERVMFYSSPCIRA